METRVWDVPLKFRFRDASVNPPVSFSFPCFWKGLYVCADLTRILSSLRRAAERPGPPDKLVLQNVLCAFGIPFLRRGLAVGVDLCDRKWYLQKPKVNYLISGFSSKFMASGLSLFFIVFYMFVVPVKIAISYFAPPPQIWVRESELTRWFNQVLEFVIICVCQTWVVNDIDSFEIVCVILSTYVYIIIAIRNADVLICMLHFRSLSPYNRR